MKFLKIIILTLILSYNFFTFAENEEDFTPIDEQITLQDASKDFSNKVIISLFGYKTFKSMLDKELIANNVTIAEIENAVAPLPYLFPKLIYVYKTISYITLFIFLSYLSYILYESFVKTQNSGNFLGQGNNPTFFILKIFLASALIFPIYNKSEDPTQTEQITAVQMLVLKTFSLSNDMGKNITDTYIQSQPKLYPEIKYIGEDSLGTHEKIGTYLIEYNICLKLNNLKPKYKIYKTETNLIIENTSSQENINDEKCRLNISYPLDHTNKDIINNNNEISQIITQSYSLNEDYLTEEEETKLSNPENNIKPYKVYETALIKSYIDFNKELNEKTENVVEVILSATNDKKQNINSVPDFEELLLNSNLNTQEHWFKKCPEILNYSSSSQLTIPEKQYYTVFASKCISNEIAKKVTYKNINDFQNYLSKDNYLNNYHLNLCTHDFNSQNGEINNIEFSYDIENENNSNETNGSSEPILNCISSECSYIDNEISNVYTCSSALSLFSSYNEEKKMSNIGFISIAPIMYRSFVSYSNFNSRKLFNDIKIESSELLKDLEKLNEININNYNNINTANAELEYSKIFFDSRSNTSSYINENLNYYLYKNTSIIYSKLINKNNKSDEISQNSLNPLNRLTKCIEKPNQINDGYICGSVPQEYNTFGSKLIGLYSTAVLLRTVVQGFREDVDDGQKIKKSGLKEKRFRKKIGKVIASGGGIIAILFFADMEEILYILGMNNNEESTKKTDAFSSYSNDINNFQNNLVNDPTFESFPEIGEATTMFSLVVIYAMLPEKIFDKISFIYSAILLLGIFIGYIIPLLPYWLFLSVLLSYFSLLLVRIILLPILSIFIMEPSQSHESSALKNIIIMFSEILFKIPLMIVGVILSWVMTNNIISKVFTLFDIESIFSLQNSSWYIEWLIFGITLIIYVILLFILTNLTITIIQTFYDFSTDWFKGQTKNIIGNSSEQNNLNKTQQYLKLGIKNKKQ